ncbi:MAG: Type 4 fimbrial assembly protein PilB [Candidatus Wolfebacteria bacterium GW2011_GWC2_46_275]|uniref:Type 4 fimbrial assembly protein PilB n=2 Tax=Candidatus Wolfeibacteriota TaxID=1752735 RepID=A0A0G1U812_9BACT|nr:MAG: type 4 fimbrial assembly protein PilB, type IV pilus assembly protein PilB [Candidatus Wolfebacteria bacterium GW2011_GWB1_47_1]KKU37066.1 MAG: Type 4 fimbrial assembly protein PilB [Candidatus Wolfebacteria bacterium GW2011_GWC2_46_275]KKU42613.1 MAG: Type 4 fimbrial assembly protein PilB [Candidatus Wolfebacteria bacterium GW2011_GWB2_46_69]KKU54652.1 MAG: Type 4 fimbrial assembly protein PilB [Candidatus Wolfebacteria bacterium GW2011_GWC1_47_103]KKU66444.1 MAG: Type 4 fimbrial assem
MLYYYSMAAIDKESIEKILKQSEDQISIIDLVKEIIEFAYISRASDIHLDPFEDKLIVRLRIDGVMHDMFHIPKSIHPEVISRIKVLSGLRTDEHQIPQDGRLQFLTSDKIKFDIRVSIVPTYHEENTVMRLLIQEGQAARELETMGFSDRDLAVIKNAIAKPFGMLLITGPTGSGKTTTLYTLLKRLNTPDVSIITIEDPVEFSLEGVDQIQVNSQTGLTFANGLRAILRQDPNIIMVGEIRDEETAAIAVNAALTGHLLLSTLHTNDAATTLPRLLDMGIEPFLIASTVNIAVAQRLVRKICPVCKQEKNYSVSALETLGAAFPAGTITADMVFYEGTGCKTCNNTGYLGRLPIYEIMDGTDAIREAIIARSSAADLKAIAMHEGMTTMLQDGIYKASQGLTTLEEILRVIHG